jgi:hypothetical protein
MRGGGGVEGMQKGITHRYKWIQAYGILNCDLGCDTEKCDVGFVDGWKDTWMTGSNEVLIDKYMEGNKKVWFDECMSERLLE